MPKVSIIMPTYNVEKYFRQCIESVINQTLTDIEIIPVDDGSPDNCGKIMDEYAAKDPRIKPIHQENGGYGKAVNAGIEAATGEYIGIVETDDYIEPDMYQKLYNQAKKFDADVCKCDFRYYYGKNKFFSCNNLKQIANEDTVFTLKENPLIMKYHVSIWSAIYKKNYLKENNIKVIESPNASYQDMPFASEVYAKGAKITILHEHLINYRAENGMDSSTIRRDGRLKLMPIMCQKAKFIFEENHCWQEVKEVAYWHFYNCSVGMFFQTEDKYKDEHYKELRKLFCDIPNENITFKYFSRQQKFVMGLILKDKKADLLIYAKYFYYANLLKRIRRRIISIRFNSKEKSILFFSKYIWRNKEHEKYNQ